jgi:DMSO reductase anchor subunit
MASASHEWPLAAFTVLACLGAGIAPPAALTGDGPLMALGGAALMAGLAISVIHLGRPQRSALVLRRVGRSRLSNEIVLAAVASVAMVTALSAGPAGTLAVVARTAAAASAVVFLITLGLVYDLGGQVTWRGTWLAPLVMGLASGAMVLVGVGPEPTRGRLAGALLLVVIDAVVFAWRWRLALAPRGPFQPVHPGIFRLRKALLASRFALFNVVAPAIVMLISGWVSLVAIVAGLVVDRVAFYGLAARRTPEAEMAAVEAVIAGARHPGQP